MNDLLEMKRQGLSLQAMSTITGFDRKTIRKYLKEAGGRPEYGPRPAAASKLDPFKPMLAERLKAGVWNAAVLLRELRQAGYSGGYTILTDWLRPQRTAAAGVAVRRFETPAGHQAQADWGHFGWLDNNGTEKRIWGFVLTLGFSRLLISEAVLDQKLGTLLRLHESAFQQLGGVPQEILYDRMKTVWKDVDERGEIVWNPIFLDFARYWGFTPRLCRAYRAQTKGKVESGVKYVRRNFLCGLQGREPGGLEDFNNQLREWTWAVANQRIHGTTHEPVGARWEQEKATLQPLDGRPPYPYGDEELRKVSRDAFVHWRGSRYSGPWEYAGKEVWVVARDHGSVDVHYGDRRIAVHTAAPHRHPAVIQGDHHAGIPMGARQERKTLVAIRETAPVVETRPLTAYEAVVGGAW